MEGRNVFFFFLSFTPSFTFLSLPSLSQHFPSPPPRPRQALGSLSKELKMVRESSDLVLACWPRSPPQEKAGDKGGEDWSFSPTAVLSDRAKKQRRAVPLPLRSPIEKKTRSGKKGRKKGNRRRAFLSSLLLFFSHSAPSRDTFSVSELQKQNKNETKTVVRRGAPRRPL